MAGQTLSLSSNTASTAFRTWGGAISTALATAGLVQTSDTGQINWTTVTNPGTTGAAYGYEVWRFADSLQSTKPIFIKLEYGAGAAAATPQMWITVGTATDGAGTLTSQSGTGTSTTSRTVCANASATLTAATGNVYVSAPDTSCIGVLAWPGISSGYGGFFFMVERTRDADGTVNSDGYVTIAANANSTSAGAMRYEQKYFYTSSQVANQITAGPPVPAFSDANLNTLIQGTTLYPLPVFTGVVPRLGGPSKLVVVLGKTDVPSNNSFTMTHYGASRTWMSAGAGASGGSGGGWGPWGAGGGTGISSFAMRMD